MNIFVVEFYVDYSTAKNGDNLGSHLLILTPTEKKYAAIVFAIAPLSTNFGIKP